MIDMRLVYPSFYGAGHVGFPQEQSRTWFTHNVQPRGLDRYVWTDFGTFRRYNTGDDSHWDEMRWRDGRLSYTETVDRAPGGQGWVKFGDGGIGCLDASWDEAEQPIVEGRIPVQHFGDDTEHPDAIGTVQYWNKIWGWDTLTLPVAGRVAAIKFSTYQRFWLTKPDGSGPWSFDWMEWWWFGIKVPRIGPQPFSGLVRTLGGMVRNNQLDPTAPEYWDMFAKARA